MVFLIDNLELYIEDIYYPQPAKKITQVFDLLTDEREIPLLLKDDFIDLKILARNNFNKELSILYDKGIVFLNLEPLDSFPFVSKNLKNRYKINSLSKLRYGRIEIRYILINPSITGSKFKITSSVSINALPKEIHITTPLGCRISGLKEGHSIGFIFISRKSATEIRADKPFICEKQGKRIYNYKLYSGYKIKDILDNTEGDPQIENRVDIIYFSQIEPMAIISTT